jgi:hypothetical protein
VLHAVNRKNSDKKIKILIFESFIENYPLYGKISKTLKSVKWQGHEMPIPPEKAVNGM